MMGETQGYLISKQAARRTAETVRRTLGRPINHGASVWRDTLNGTQHTFHLAKAVVSQDAGTLADFHVLKPTGNKGAESSTGNTYKGYVRFPITAGDVVVLISLSAAADAIFEVIPLELAGLNTVLLEGAGACNGFDCIYPGFEQDGCDWCPEGLTDWKFTLPGLSCGDDCEDAKEQQHLAFATVPGVAAGYCVYQGNPFSCSGETVRWVLLVTSGGFGSLFLFRLADWPSAVFTVDGFNDVSLVRYNGVKSWCCNCANEMLLTCHAQMPPFCQAGPSRICIMPSGNDCTICGEMALQLLLSVEGAGPNECCLNLNGDHVLAAANANNYHKLGGYDCIWVSEWLGGVCGETEFDIGKRMFFVLQPHQNWSLGDTRWMLTAQIHYCQDIGSGLCGTTCVPTCSGIIDAPSAGIYTYVRGRWALENVGEECVITGTYTREAFGGDCPELPDEVVISTI